VVNDVSLPGIGFDAADNAVTIVTPDGDVAVPKASKAEVARAILDMILSVRTSPAVKVEQ
jgi:phosphopantothenoylcysteine decarboxylase/phosphopantothenate--cysteine ligase